MVPSPSVGVEFSTPMHRGGKWLEIESENGWMLRWVNGWTAHRHTSIALLIPPPPTLKTGRRPVQGKSGRKVGNAVAKGGRR